MHIHLLTFFFSLKACMIIFMFMFHMHVVLLIPKTSRGEFSLFLEPRDIEARQPGGWAARISDCSECEWQMARASASSLTPFCWKGAYGDREPSMLVNPSKVISLVPGRAIGSDIHCIYCHHLVGSLACQIRVIREKRPSESFQNCIIPLLFQAPTSWEKNVQIILYPGRTAAMKT